MRGVGETCRGARSPTHSVRAGRAEDAAGVVAAPVTSAVWAQEDVPAVAAVLADAGAPVPCTFLWLGGQQSGEERGKIHRQVRFPVRAALGVVLRRQPVEAP